MARQKTLYPAAVLDKHWGSYMPAVRAKKGGKALVLDPCSHLGTPEQAEERAREKLLASPLADYYRIKGA